MYRSALQDFLKSLDWSRPYVDLYSDVETWLMENTFTPTDEVGDLADDLVSSRIM